MKRPAKQSQAVRLRLAAVAVLAAVLDRGQSLEPALAAGLEAVDERDRALLAEICNGVLRWHRLLETLLARTLRKPLRERERDLQRLLLVAAYQLCFMRVPDYAVVDGAVATARAGGWTWASGLVNAVLRNLARQHREWTGAIDDPAVRWALPDWIAARWRRDWPENFADLAEASAARPPMWLRVDRRRGSPAGYREELAAAGLTAESSAVGADALRLAEPVAVDRLPGFDQGRVSVQDLSAQLAAPLLAPQPGQRVLDACAAPGGKTLHLLEWQPELAELVALDSDELRLQRVRQNLDRCGCRASLVCADAGEVERWWDGRCRVRAASAPGAGSGCPGSHPVTPARRAVAVAGAGRYPCLFDLFGVCL